ncbi:amidohydrolase [Pseudohalioglobus sediminis]|uniref:Amidohydrolase n=1 Tax=Pseudohalioglobus sediminis TaxID=2606449 RepID=A0A5B0X6K2_9GAMM|nr:amidohydrolase [Pseudohalioglobus sediminis]KAA1193961.1 amidohydrolase [Pseudohalioglobus sediminis]
MLTNRLTLALCFLLGTPLLASCQRSEPERAPPSPVVGASAVEVADTIYFGGPIITVDEAAPAAEAVAVRAGRIQAVGTMAELEPLTSPDTQRIDLKGRTLAPGFVDGHMHINGLGLQAIGANLLAPPDGEVRSIDDLVESLQQWAGESNDDERIGWIFGMGFDDAILEERRFPTRDDLDRVSTDKPVMAIHISGHFASVNSKGLEVIGYTADTPDPEGGIIQRRPGSMEPNGVLEELAAIPVYMREISPRTPEDARYVMEQGLELAMSFGYTTAQEGRAFVNIHNNLAAYADAVGFPIDVVSYIDYADLSPLSSDWYGKGYQNGYRVGGVKVTLDGSPQGRTAWRTEPYLLPPEGQGPDYAGYPAIPDDQVVIDIVDQAYRNGWQVLMHVNGDAAVDQMIRAIRPAQKKYGPGDRRHVLVHGQYTRLDQLPEMAELQIVGSFFPMHTFYWGDWHVELIGPDKARHISPVRSALDHGIPITSHTDAPVVLPNLMQVMWATVNRVTRSGKILGPEERLTPEEAFKAVTLWGAWQHFEEDEKGSLTRGKRADLVILSDNPLTIEPMRINDIVVLETIKDGQTVWRREAP